MLNPKWTISSIQLFQKRAKIYNRQLRNNKNLIEPNSSHVNVIIRWTNVRITQCWQTPGIYMLDKNYFNSTNTKIVVFSLHVDDRYLTIFIFLWDHTFWLMFYFFFLFFFYPARSIAFAFQITILLPCTVIVILWLCSIMGFDIIYCGFDSVCESKYLWPIAQNITNVQIYYIRIVVVPKTFQSKWMQNRKM